jgi:hypothetical protein
MAKTIKYGSFTPIKGTGSTGTIISISDDNFITEELYLAIKDNTGENLCMGFSKGDQGTCYDNASKTLTSGRILKFTSGGSTIVEVEVPSDAFASGGDIKLNVITGTASRLVNLIAVGEVK